MPRDLQTTYRNGRLLAAYLYFRKGTGVTVARTVRHPDGMNIDYDADGRPLGIEFIAPSRITLAKVNALLEQAGQVPATEEELWPILRPNISAPAA